MKKHYIKPSLLCLKIALRGGLLQTSIQVSQERQTDESFARQQNSSVWDDDWDQ